MSPTHSGFASKAQRAALAALIIGLIALTARAGQPVQARAVFQPTATAEATSSSPVPPIRKIAFWGDPGTARYFISGMSQCFVIDSDGSNLTPVTHYDGDCFYPAWSPDGKRIAFVSYQKVDTNQLYAVNADGSGLTRLTNLLPSGTDTDIVFDWSPDGKYIVYSARNALYHYQIYRMDADGKNVTRLTNGSQVVDRHGPVWSPDSKRIAFITGFDADVEISVMDADGSHLTRLTNTSDLNFFPVWSPDSKRIAYLTHYLGHGGYIGYLSVMNADGSHSKHLNTDLQYFESLRWSPDGRQILFASEATQNLGINRDQIFVMSADGSNIKQLTQTNGYGPRWSPDGSQIAYAAIDRGANLFVMNRDGLNIKKLTNFISEGPAWQPDSVKP